MLRRSVPKICSLLSRAISSAFCEHLPANHLDCATNRVEVDVVRSKLPFHHDEKSVTAVSIEARTVLESTFTAAFESGEVGTL